MIATPGQINRRATLYYQLASLLGAGVPILQALEMARRNHPAFRAKLGTVLGKVEGGETLSEAFGSTGKWMPAFDLALLSAGEASGRLDAVFRQLGNHYQDQARMARMILSGLVYPVFLLHLAVLIFPTRLLTGLFLNGGVERFLSQKIAVLLPLYLITFAALVAFQGSRGRTWRALMERFTAGIPVLGRARHELALSRLSGALEALISAGIPIIRAWDIAAVASGSNRIYRSISRALPDMESGMTPAETIQQIRAFPELFQQLYASGEVSGQLDSTLERLRKHYQEEAQHRFAIITSWTPKLIFFLIAILIAHQVITFYLGYFDQLNQLGL